MLTSRTKNDFENENSDYKVTTNAIKGGNARFAAPIPYVAPFFELVIGGSVGSLVPRTPLTDRKKNGLIMIIPFTIGLAIARNHRYEAAFTYYYHDAVQQFGGAVTFGMAFPLE